MLPDLHTGFSRGRSDGLVFPSLSEHTVKCFGIVNKAEIDVFLELSCFFHDPADVGNLISGSSAFSKTRLNIWNFTVHLLLGPDILECEVKWALESIATNKASGGDGIPVELFQILKDNAVKVQ